MLISAKIIKSSRVNRICCECGRYIGKEKALRMFGMAHHGDVPYALYCHVACACAAPLADPRIRRLVCEEPREL